MAPSSPRSVRKGWCWSTPTARCMSSAPKCARFTTSRAPAIRWWRRSAPAIGAGMSLVDAARLANIAAGIVVGKVGTAVVYAERAGRPPRRPRPHAADKVMPRAHAARPGRALAPPGAQDRLYQRLLRSAASRPCGAAAAGQGGLRPARRRPQQRRIGGAAQGADPPGAERKRAGRGAGLAGRGRSDRDLRGRHAARADPGIAPAALGQGGRLPPRRGGRRRISSRAAAARCCSPR